MQTTDYSTVTETWGLGASQEQVEMAACRYAIAGELANDKRVLEIGCGAGLGLQHLRSKARFAVGGDLTMSLLRQAQVHMPGAAMARLDAQALPFCDHAFDVVLLLEVIYYIPDLDRAFAECRRVLDRGGALMVCLPNRDRTDFNPSPYSIDYPNVPELSELFARHGFGATVYGGFRIDSKEVGLFDRIRHIAVRWHLIPRSMRMKAFVKRLLYGRLPKLNAIDPAQVSFEPPMRIVSDKPTSAYKNLYVVGQLSKIDSGL